MAARSNKPRILYVELSPEGQRALAAIETKEARRAKEHQLSAPSRSQLVQRLLIEAARNV